MVDVNIRYGFQAVHSKLNFNTLKRTNLYKSGHVFDVNEQKLCNGISIISALVIRQTIQSFN